MILLSKIKAEPVVADGKTCARCGADKAEARKYRFSCLAFARHIWKWEMEGADGS